MTLYNCGTVHNGHQPLNVSIFALGRTQYVRDLKFTSTVENGSRIVIFISNQTTIQECLVHDKYIHISSILHPINCSDKSLISIVCLQLLSMPQSVMQVFPKASSSYTLTYIIDKCINCRNILCIFIRNFHVEFLLNCHDKLHCIQRVRTQIINEL